MSDDTNTPTDDAATDANDTVETTVSSTYKVLGEDTLANGAGVLGKNTAGSGTPIGVEGAVPNNTTGGYGLSTPHNARIEGVLDSNETDFVIEAGTTATMDAQNVIQGHASNQVRNGVVGATIGGGGFSDGSFQSLNKVFNDYGTVAGGRNNKAGIDGTATDVNKYATIGGGTGNEAKGRGSTVAGGIGNRAESRGAVGGGVGNEAHYTATVPGGEANVADGNYSFAAGRYANTAGHKGAFVLADSTTDLISAENDDEVRSQMNIYAPNFILTSARANKRDIESVDPSAVLEQVESLNVHTWEFIKTDDGRHMGPMAGEFHDAFELGPDDEHIATVDADGVALAAIQGLAERLEQKDLRIEDLEAENEQLRQRNDDLEARLEVVEDHLGIETTTDHPSSAND